MLPDPALRSTPLARRSAPLAARFSLFGALVLALAGCGPSPEHQAEMEQLRGKVQELEAANKGLEKENTELTGQARQLKAEMERLKARETWSRLGIAEGGSLRATLQTTKGAIHCELWPKDAPQTVLNFVELAEGSREWTDPASGEKVKRPLYDGTIFHRVIPKFMIQGGDPLGTGTGGPGYEFADEVASGRGFSEPGLLAMANAGPNTNGSQFFITDRATPDHLNGKHTIFGKCDDLGVVQAIADAPTGPRDRPETDIVLQKVSIQR